MEAIKQVILLEKEALKAWSGGNATGYGVHAHPELVYFDNLGAQNLLEGGEQIQSYAEAAFAELPEHTYEMVGLKAKQYGDTVILAYQYHPTMLDGTPSSKWAATVVYALFETTWKMVHASWTMLMPPPN
jgi:hypothetical protein